MQGLDDVCHGLLDLTRPPVIPCYADTHIVINAELFASRSVHGLVIITVTQRNMIDTVSRCGTSSGKEHSITDELAKICTGTMMVKPSFLIQSVRIG